MEQEVHIHGYRYVLGVILQYGHTVSFLNEGTPTHTPGGLTLSFCSDIGPYMCYKESYPVCTCISNWPLYPTCI